MITTSGGPARLAIIGDVGGHLPPLVEQLIVLGVDIERREMPADLVICQVGDLVHRGPDSDAIVELVGDLLSRNPGHWVQLVGNHEQQYLPGQLEFWSPRITHTSARTLRDWWEAGHLRIAAAFPIAARGGEPDPDGDTAVDSCPPGDLLVTHAGLTAGAWRDLDSPRSARDIAEILNTGEHRVTWRQGGMTTGRTDHAAGPLWAEAVGEVYASWSAAGKRPGGPAEPGFAQAHGHSSPHPWGFARWQPFHPAECAADPQRKITRVRVGSQVFFGTDPQAGVAPATVSVPLILPLEPGPAECLDEIRS